MKVSLSYSGVEFDRRYFVASKDVRAWVERDALLRRTDDPNVVIVDRVKVHLERVQSLAAAIASARKAIRLGREGQWGFYLDASRLSELETMVVALAREQRDEGRAFCRDVEALVERK